MKRSLFIVLLVLISVGVALAQPGVKKKRPLPYEYGKVVINNYSGKATGHSPVVFDHWLHRSLYTCRLCHVDIGFAMKTGDTNIKAADNQAGYYCGTCHNGRMVFNDRKIFEACAERSETQDMKKCEWCHSLGKNVRKEYDFNTFTKNFPRGSFGNNIDWEKAEDEGKVKLIDYLEGVSIKRKPLPMQKDFELKAKLEGMPDIIFSHEKHTVWNGCELCHPEIFPSVKRGSVKYTMLEIYEGKYCGACHNQVAFPPIDCQRCHTAVK